MTRAAVVIVALFTLAPLGYAHKGITSKFTYNADVHPVFLARCGRCHRDGGVGPMSLLKYEDAFPWAESLRAEMLTAAKVLTAYLKGNGGITAKAALAAQKTINRWVRQQERALADRKKQQEKSSIHVDSKRERPNGDDA